MEIRCNICDEIISTAKLDQHIGSRNHVVKKKVAEFHEMNVQVKPTYQDDRSIVMAWIKNLYNYDFLSTGKI